VVPGGINHDTADIDGVTVIDADHGKVVIVRRTFLMIVWRVSYGITACNDFRFGLYIADSRVLVNSVIELRLGAEIDSCDLVTASFIRVIGHNVNHAVHRMAQNRMGAFVYSQPGRILNSGDQRMGCGVASRSAVLGMVSVPASSPGVSG
jgi:hypothetical protein